MDQSTHKITADDTDKTPPWPTRSAEVKRWAEEAGLPEGQAWMRYAHYLALCCIASVPVLRDRVLTKVLESR